MHTVEVVESNDTQSSVPLFARLMKQAEQSPKIFSFCVTTVNGDFLFRTASKDLYLGLGRLGVIGQCLLADVVDEVFLHSEMKSEAEMILKLERKNIHVTRHHNPNHETRTFTLSLV